MEGTNNTSFKGGDKKAGKLKKCGENGGLTEYGVRNYHVI